MVTFLGKSFKHRKQLRDAIYNLELQIESRKTLLTIALLKDRIRLEAEIRDLEPQLEQLKAKKTKENQEQG